MDARRPRAQSLTQSRLPLWTASALVCGAAIAAFGFGARAGDMRDFEVYWTAATRAAAGEPLYRASDEHYQFKYLPAFAVLAWPLSLVSLEGGKSAWFVISVALIPALLALSILLLPERRRRAGVLAAAMVIVMGKFFGHELVLGQVNLLFATIVTAGLWWLRTGSSVRASTALVAAVVVKPYAVIFLPWLAWIRGTRAVVTCAIASAVVVALPALRYGVRGTWNLHLAWWRTVSESTAPNLTNPDNVSLAAFFAKWIGVGPSASLWTALASVALLALAATVVAWGRGSPGREPLEGAMLATLIPLLSPQGWDYVFLVATPAVAIFVNYDDRLSAAIRWTTWVALAIAGLSLFDILGRQRYAVFMSWSVITVSFMVLVAALASLRGRRAA